MDLSKQFSVAVVAVCLAASNAAGQTNINPTLQPDRSGRVVAPEKLTATDASTTSNLRPARPERQNLPPEVKARIDRFKDAARAYLEQRETLKKQLEGANDQERAAIREKIKQLREQWLEKAREMRKEFRERAEELKARIPELNEVLQSARDAALEQTQNNRPHLGEERP